MLISESHLIFAFFFLTVIVIFKIQIFFKKAKKKGETALESTYLNICLHLKKQNKNMCEKSSLSH